MIKSESADVVVVGAGPTGLMLACELMLAGVDVLLLERRPSGTGESRAPGINARTMEILEQRGLAAQFRQAGRALPAVLFSGIPMVPARTSPGWPDALILLQHQTERLLGERAADLGVRIAWSTEVLHVTQDQHAVELTVLSNGKKRELRAQYVVGCDGAHSAVRRACGGRFEGDDPVSHWIVADVQLASPPAEGATFGRNIRVGTYQVSSVEPDWYRVSMMKLSPPTDRRSPVSLDELRQTMLEGIGTDYGLYHARWASRFTDGFRQVEQYRYGRVLLAGDAAHTHSPIGGQGLNLGMQDAFNLGWKLAAVVARGVEHALLDTYHIERHPVARDVLQMAKAQTALIKPGHQIDALRNVFTSMLEVPETMHDLAGFLSGLTLRYSWGEKQHPLVGCRLPNLVLDVAGTKIDVYRQMHCGRPLLITFGAASFDVPERWRTRVKRIDAEALEADSDEMWRLPVVGAVPALEAMFVRPDGYIAWAKPLGAPSSPTQLIDALQAWAG